MQRYPHLATRLYNAALLLTPGKAEVLDAVFRSAEAGNLATPSATAKQERPELAAPGMVRSEAGYYRTADGVALIPVLGTLVQRGDSIDAMSGLTGYNRVAKMLAAALDDPRVGGVLLEVDSPGGEANGAFDLAAKIRAANAIKPVWVSANEQAFSAAYLIASAAERIAVPESGMVGSIGVVMMHVDQSGKDAKAGITFTPIYAGARKMDFSQHAPLSEDAMGTAQAEVDRVYDLFVSAVATGRGIAPEVVRKTEAGLLAPSAALDQKLVDAVESFDATLSELTAEVHNIRMTGQRRRMPARASSTNGGTTMDSKQPAAQATSDTTTTAAAAATSAPAASAPSSADAAKAAADAERARVQGILGHAEAQGRRALAEHLAFKGAHSIDEAAAILAASPREAPAPASNAFAEHMERLGNPKVGADAGTTADEQPKRIATAAEVYAFRRECVAKHRRSVH